MKTLSIVKLNCPVCKNCNFYTYQKVYDDRYGEPNIYNLAKCSKCNHIATYPRLQQKELEILYKKFYPRKNIRHEDILKKKALKNNFLTKLIKWLQGTNNQGQLSAKSGEYVLDIGCGDCSSLIEIENKGAKAYGIEADRNVESIARNLNLKVHFGSIEDNPFSEILFDLIVMNQVIEHVPDPDLTLKFIKKKLKRKGHIIFVFPNQESFWRKITGTKWINWHIPYHLHHFNKKNFELMLDRCGYEIINQQTITPNLWTILQVRHIFNDVRIGELNNIWQVKKNSNFETKKFFLKFKFARKIFEIIILSGICFFNRLIDAIKLGDSLMIEAKIKN